jgi:hypothetical protein
MDGQRILFFYLWIAPHAMLLVVSVIMMRRQLVREYPVFFVYTLYELFQFAVLFTIYLLPSVSGPQWAATWIVGEAVSVILRFAIVREIFGSVFENFSSLKKFGNSLFHWSTAALVALAVIVVAQSPGNQTDRVSAALNAIDRIVSIVQCGQLLVLVVLSRYLKFSWGNYVFGIALGLGLFESLKLVNAALQNQYTGSAAIEFFNLSPMVMYHCCVLLWIVTLLRPERQPNRSLAMSMHNLNRWNDALERLFHS